MIRKPDDNTRNAVELYELLTRVIVLAEIYEPEAVEAAAEWLRTSGTGGHVVDAAVLLLNAARED